VKGTIVKLIAFAAVCLFFTGYLAFTIGNVHPFRGTYSLSASFDDVTGLLPDDNVKVAGVVVGKVKKISVDNGRAKVGFSVRKNLKLPSDTQAAVRWRNLLGQRYVYLYPGQASTVLTDNAHIAKTRSVVDLGELFNRLGPIVQALDPKQINAFLDSVVGALDGNEDKIRQSLDDLATLTQGLAARDQAIGRMVDNLNTVAGTINSRDAQIKTVLDNLVAVSKTFSDNTDVLDRALVDAGQFSDNLNYLLSRNRSELDSLITNLNTITNTVNTKLPVVDDLLSHLYEGSKRLFTSSSYGDWLNQIIPCGRLGYPATVSATNCGGVGNFPGAPNQPPTPSAGAGAGAPGASTTTTIATQPIGGVDGIISLLGGGR
jgi:phospholipid/cholesterol/gamma-HCH transport system substrate-binding protein